jgi:hypothetical protein
VHRGLIQLAQAESAAAVAALLTANPTLPRGGAYDADDWELSFAIAQGLVDEKEIATAERFVALLLSRSDAGRNAPVSVLFELYFLASQLAADRDDTRVAVRRLRSLRTIVTRRVGPDR